MKYQSILKRLEDEEKDKVISAKLYRYSGLVQAIDYFSQKLVFEQIIDAAFDFINELLLIDYSAIFVHEDDGYNVKKVKGFKYKFTKVPMTIELQNLATLSGNILYEQDKLIKFFAPDLIDAMAVNAAVPLIIEGTLYGFILFRKKEIGEDDYIISEALMRLINNALENFSRYEKLASINSELDEKIFNLFAINQSSKILLSELRMDELYNISVDVFSELTRSRITGFVLYDERAERYQIKAYKDVFYKQKDIDIDLVLENTDKIDPNKVIINLGDKSDCEYLNGLFEGISAQLEQLETQYVVLILKNSEILGFVTLSETVTGSGYSHGIFELIESLAASTYTALTNAKLFGLVNDQKLIIQKKLDKLISLNVLTKNISSSIRIDTLLETCTKTLQISFNTTKGAFCLYEKDSNMFEFVNTINLDNCHKKNIVPNIEWRRIFEGDTVFAVGQNNIVNYFGENLAADIGEAQGVLLVPVYLDMINIELLGVIAIFDYEGIQLDNEENMLILETIAGSIAPVLNSLIIMELQQRFMLPNYIEIFKRDLKEEVKQALDYDLDLTVLQIIDENGSLFKSNSVIDKLKDCFRKVYPFSSNNIFVIENSSELELNDKIKNCIGNNNLAVKRMKLGKEFKNFAGFFEQYR